MQLKKFTHYVFVLLLISVIGCQQDDIYMNEQSTEGSATITKISFNQIKSDPKHRRVAGTVDAFEKSVKLKHNATGRLVYNEEYGFYIDEENGIYIEDGEKHSYTFRIERPETGEKIENIVFTPDGSGGYKTMLAWYDIDKDEFYTLTEAELKEREVQISEYGRPPGTLNLVCKLVWRFEMAPPREGNNDGGDVQYEGIWVVDVIDCHWTGGAASGPGGGGDSGGGASGPGAPDGPACCGGGGTGGSGNGGPGPWAPHEPVVTTPVVKTPQNPDPCPKLQALLNPATTNLNNYINAVKQFYNQGMKSEVSYSFKRAVGQNGDVYSAAQNIGTETMVKIDNSQSVYSAIHLHPKRTKAAGGIFSWLDIRTLGDIYDGTFPSNREDNNVSLLLLCPNPATSDPDDYNIYAITVKNMEVLRAAIHNEWNSPKWANITDTPRRLDAIQNDLGDAYTKNYHNLENYFLQRFSGYGISLYKLDNNNNDSNWNQLLPSSTPGQPLKKTCN